MSLTQRRCVQAHGLTGYYAPKCENSVTPAYRYLPVLARKKRCFCSLRAPRRVNLPCIRHSRTQFNASNAFLCHIGHLQRFACMQNKLTKLQKLHGSRRVEGIYTGYCLAS